MSLELQALQGEAAKAVRRRLDRAVAAKELPPEATLSAKVVLATNVAAAKAAELSRMSPAALRSVADLSEEEIRTIKTTGRPSSDLWDRLAAEALGDIDSQG